MVGEPIWDGWEEPTKTLNKFAWILTLVGGILRIVFGIVYFSIWIVLLPVSATISLMSGIIYGGIAVAGAIILMPISKKISAGDYENVNLVMLIISGVMGLIGAWYYFWAIPHILIAIFFCFLSEYGWIAKNK